MLQYAAMLQYSGKQDCFVTYRKREIELSGRGKTLIICIGKGEESARGKYLPKYYKKITRFYETC